MLKLFRLAAIATILTFNTFNSPASIAGSATNLQGAGAKVIVYNLNYDGNTQKYIGQVLNRTGKTLKLLKLHYQLLNGQGQVIDVGSVFILEDELRGQQSGAFSLRASKESGVANMVITSAEWIGD